VTIPAGEVVRVWYGQVDTARFDPSDVGLLGPQERDRYLRFHRDDSARRYAAAHAAVRRVLGRFLCTAPAAVRLTRHPCPVCGSEDHGPPRAVGPGGAVAVSISRSGVHWTLAVTRDGPIGVDVEDARPTSFDGVARRCLSEDERRYLAGLAAPHRLSAFYRCWTRKEAVVKACGVGLATDLRSVRVRPWRPGAVVVVHEAGTGPGWWTVVDVATGPDRFTALARPVDRAASLIVHEEPVPVAVDLHAP
jgi:4'-phosphopantetheinyl transferase